MRRRSLLLVTAGLGLTGPALLAGCAAPSLRQSSGAGADAADLAPLNRDPWGVDSTALAASNRHSRRDDLQAQLRSTSCHAF